MKKLITLLLVLVLLVSLAPGALGAPHAGPELVILHTAGIHGHAGGFAALAALKKRYEDAGASVLLLDSGGAWSGTAFASLDRGESLLKLMEASGYAAASVSPDDFSYGFARLSALADASGITFLCANAEYADGSGPAFEKYVLKACGGLNVGVFGLAWGSEPGGLGFTDPCEAAAATVAQLRALGADYIVALTWLGDTADAALVAGAVDGIDLIIDGSAEKVSASLAGDTLIASSGELLENIGVVEVDGARGLSAPSAVDAAGIAPDAGIDALLRELTEKQEPLLNTVAAQLSRALDSGGAQSGETALGDLVADAMRALTGAAIALQRGDGLRAGLPAGAVTRGDLINALPDFHDVVTLTLTGRQVREALEQGLAALPEPSPGFLQVSGVRIVYDPALPPGSRLLSVRVGGKPLDDGARYSVAVSSPAASDRAFAPAPASALGMTQDEALAVYLRALDVLPSGEGRIAPGRDGDTYTVRPGDCLWAIAKKLYGDGRLWTRIYEKNRAQIRDPNLIFPAMVLAV